MIRHKLIAPLIVCICMAIFLAAKSLAAPSVDPIRGDEGVPTFRTEDGMTEIERMIARGATTCLTQWEVEGQTFYYSTPCLFVEKLRAALLKKSEAESLQEFLISNDFKCQKVADEARCRNEFRTIQNPLWDGKKIAPDINHTFITEVGFTQLKPGLSVEDIKVTFTHFETRGPN
jgi:hypothetical protein